MFCKSRSALLFPSFVVSLILGFGPNPASAQGKPDTSSGPSRSDSVLGMDRWISLFPKSSGLHYLRGLARANLRDDNGALADYDEALRLNDKAVWVYMDRAVVYRRKEQFDSALADYDTAISMRPKNAGLFAARSLVWNERFDNDHAIADLTQAIALNPKNAGYFGLRAYAWIMKHDPDKALIDVDRALELSPERELALQTDTLPGMRRPAVLPALSPQRKLALQARAFAHTAKGDYARGISDIDEILKRDPKDQYSVLFRSGLHYIRGDYPAALSDYRNTIFKDSFSDAWKDTLLRRKDGASTQPQPVMTSEKKQRMLWGEFSDPDKSILDGCRRDDQGFIDYVKAVNDRCSRGVTPQNNAAIPLYQAFGPIATPWTASDAYYRMLQMAKPAEYGSYLIQLRDCKNESDGQPVRADSVDWVAAGDEWKKLFSALNRPWSKREFPRLAQCIESNRVPLAKVVEASYRSKYYCPAIAPTRDLPFLCTYLPGPGHIREAVQLLAARAMLNLNGGNVDDAWQDTLTVFRLSRLVAQGPATVDHLLGISLHDRALRLTASIAHYGKLPKDRCDYFRRDLEQLPRFPPLADQLRYFERYVFQDAVQRIARIGPIGLWSTVHNISLLSTEPTGRPRGKFGPPYQTIWLYNESIDWDEVMRLGDADFETATQIFERPTRKARNAARDSLDRKLRNDQERLKGNSVCQPFPYFLIGVIPRELSSTDFAQMLVGLTMYPIVQLCDVEDRLEIEQEMPVIVLALAAYRSDHRSYPKRLADLAPDYLATIPKDIFLDGDLHYSQKGEGYDLYSVGPNKKDDGGRGRDDTPPGDDVAIRMPPHQLP
jgi:tetratricopeptide (TPR) repeat protein